jgi:hypothetical protein
LAVDSPQVFERLTSRNERSNRNSKIPRNEVVDEHRQHDERHNNIGEITLPGEGDYGEGYACHRRDDKKEKPKLDDIADME